MNRAEPPSPPRLSRRTVVRALSWLCAAPMPVLAASMIDRHLRLARSSTRVEILAPADGFSFQDGVIVSRTGPTTRVFSSRCTHLGCRISTTQDGLLVCPCHGSRFRPDGSVAAGPAVRPLESLPFTTDARTGALIVHVS